MIRALREFYGLQPAPPSELFQFCVWEILSEGALPARRDLAWQALKRIPALTPDAMFRVPAKELLDAIGMAGPRREEKLDRIRDTVGEFRRQRELLGSERLRGAAPLAAARALRRLPHLSRDRRARAHLFVLDAHVLPFDEAMRRVVSRLIDDGTSMTRPAARAWLLQQLAGEAADVRDAVLYLRHHAQQTCVTVAPHCGVCPLRSTCGFARRSVQ